MSADRDDLPLAVDRCDSDDMGDKASLTLRLLTPLLVPGAPIPKARFEALPDYGAAYESGPVPTVLLDPRTLSGTAHWPGPDATRSERIECLVLLAVHELAHHRLAQFGEPVDDHGASFWTTCQRFAEILGMPAPADAEEASRWPMSAFERGDGTARKILDRARRAAGRR